MRLLISGATGLVGRHVFQEARARQHAVRVFSRDASRARARLGRDLDAVEWDPSRENAPPHAFEDVDAVLHLAGESVVGRWTESKRQAIVDSRVLGTRRLVAGMREASNPAIALISASAIGYYGECGDDEVREERGPGEDFLAECAVGWERESQVAAEFGHRVVNPRIGIVLAREGGALASMLPAFRFGLGGRLGSGRQWWSWIHISDLVALLLDSITGNWSGPVNATAPEAVRQADFARRLAAVLHRPAALPAPAWALRLLLGGFAVELLGSKRVLPHRAMQLGFQPSFASLDEALSDLLGPR